MPNFMKKWFCKLPTHDPIVRYNGMSVIGYKCTGCGYEWYEDRGRDKKSLTTNKRVVNVIKTRSKSHLTIVK